MLTFIGVASAVVFIGLMFWTDDGVLGRRLSRVLEREERQKRYKELIAKDEARIERVVESLRAMLPRKPAFLEAAE